MPTADLTSLIPAIGAVSQHERLFRVNWVSALLRSPTGTPFQEPELVASQGGSLAVVDLRGEAEMLGEWGFIPGSSPMPAGGVAALAQRLRPDDPVVIVCRDGFASAVAAQEAERAGLRFVAAMRGGIDLWRRMGFGVCRDRRALRPHVARPQLGSADAPIPAGGLSAEMAWSHVGEPVEIRRVKLAALLLHGLLSCVDGRDDGGVVGTPGGDAGELSLLLASAERLLGRAFTRAEVSRIFRQRLGVFGRFYMHTDIAAGNRTIKALRADPRFAEVLAPDMHTLEWRAFLANPPQEVREALLEVYTQPDHLGCGHLKRSMLFPELYGVRAALVGDILRAVLETRWAGAPGVHIAPLAGGHGEGAVYNVLMAEDQPYSDVPIVSPSRGGVQAFVNHPQVTAQIRAQLAAFLCHRLPGLDAGALFAEQQRLGAQQAGATLGALAAGLPVYDLRFDDAGGLTIVKSGQIPG